MTDFTFNSLLSRYAECIMWLARYMERMENLARLLEVTETFVRDGEGQTAWESIININSDEALFARLHPDSDQSDAVAFYITEQANPGSILSMAVAIRDNARAVRPPVSTDIWTHLNVFTRWLLVLDTIRAKLYNLSAL